MKLETHCTCTRTAQSSRGGCSRRVHKIVHLAVKKGNTLINILQVKVLIANYCHLYFQLRICFTKCTGLSDSRYSTLVNVYADLLVFTRIVGTS